MRLFARGGTRGRIVLAALAFAGIVSVAVSSSAGASSGRSALAGSTPAWANSKNLVAAANASDTVGFRLYLGWNNPSAVESLAQAVSNPASPSYRHYLTPQQFRQQFAPSQAQVGAVQSWLKSQGFTVEYTPQNNHYVSAEGTVAQAAAAFGVTFGEYSVQGLTVRSPEATVSIPDSLAGFVSGVIGLDDSAQFVQTDHVIDAPPSAGFRNAPPLAVYHGQLASPYAAPTGFTDKGTTVPWAVKGYTPAQIKGAYGISSSYDGSGQTVAIIDAYASPTIVSDVNQWSANRGLPGLSPSQFQQVVAPGTYHHPEAGKKQDPQGWYGEETLDVEAVHGMAPGAKIVYVGAPNAFQDLDAALNAVVDKGLAQIVTNSYGFDTEQLAPGFIKPYEDTILQGAVEGIGIYFSSGDNGDETQTEGYATPDWPASSPYVTAVGGTSLAVGADNSRLFETGWGTSNYNCDTTTLACTRTGWLYGAGGGVSSLFAEPSYQQAAGLSLSGRGVPDVAAIADPQTGMLVGQTQSFPDGNYYDEYRIGGTSLASPIFAGLMALADQKAGFAHGFVNPLLYANKSAFYDVLPVKTAVARRNFNNSVDATAGTADRLRTFDDYSGSPTQHTGTGWDNVTGLGTPGSSFLSLIG